MDEHSLRLNPGIKDNFELVYDSSVAALWRDQRVLNSMKNGTLALCKTAYPSLRSEPWLG